jgi:hypothetical protein
MELPMIYKISPRPSFPKRGRKRPTRLREDPKLLTGNEFILIFKTTADIPVKGKAA